MNDGKKNAMKAIVQDEYGPLDVLELREVDVPVFKDNEVVVRVRATSVHPDIWHVVTGRPYALRVLSGGALKPKSGIPGADVAGLVESVSPVGRQQRRPRIRAATQREDA